MPQQPRSTSGSIVCSACGGRIDDLYPAESAQEPYSEADLARFQQAQQLFDRLGAATARSTTGLADADVVRELKEILAAYRQLRIQAPAPPVLDGLLAESIANTLETLGRAQAALAHLEQVEGTYAEAMEAFDGLGSPGRAAGCRRKLQEIALRRSANLDEAVQHL